MEHPLEASYCFRRGTLMFGSVSPIKVARRIFRFDRRHILRGDAADGRKTGFDKNDNGRDARLPFAAAGLKYYSAWGRSGRVLCGV